MLLPPLFAIFFFVFVKKVIVLLMVLVGVTIVFGLVASANKSSSSCCRNRYDKRGRQGPQFFDVLITISISTGQGRLPIYTLLQEPRLPDCQFAETANKTS